MFNKEIVEIIIMILSFVLSMISVITVIISLSQNNKQLKINEAQIKEMIREHRLSMQPLLVISDPVFEIEPPRLFFTPPTKEYSLHSRYYVSITINNVSNANAISVDGMASISLKQGDKTLFAESSTKRINCITSNKDEHLEFMFAFDRAAVVYNALREESVKFFPSVEINLYYKNTAEGVFCTSYKYIISISDEDKPQLREWHGIIANSEIDYKEDFNRLRKERKHDEVSFYSLKKKINDRIHNDSRLSISCIEIPEEYVYKSIDENDYVRIKKDFHYPRFVGPSPVCKTEKNN